MALALLKKTYVVAYLQDTNSSEVILSDVIAPYIEDYNVGWVGTGNGVWTYESPTQSYSDIYSVQGGHKYYLTLGETVGTRFRVMFTTVDVSTVSSGKVTGTAVNKSNYNNPSPNQNLYYTTPSDGYIIVQKDNVGVTGIKTYLYDTISRSPIFCQLIGSVKENFDTSKVLAISNAMKSCFKSSVQVKAVKKVEGYLFGKTDIALLFVTPPAKASYKTGEIFDFSDAVVTAIYENGKTVNVTNEATFTPADGAVVALSDSNITVSYKGLFAYFDLTIEGTIPTALSVTPPTKTTYLKGEALDYTGCSAIATYGDGTTRDVTNLAVFTPANGTVINNNNNLTVSVSYQEGSETVSNSFPITVAYLNSLTVTAPTKTHYIGDTLDYTGLNVTANYKNANSVDVTSSAVITPVEGTIITTDIVTGPETISSSTYYNLKINIAYTDAAGDKKTKSVTIDIPHLEVTKPNKIDYHVGEALDYTGLAVKLDNVDLTSSITTQYPEGTVVPSSWHNNASYSQMGFTFYWLTFYYVDTSENKQQHRFGIRVYP